MPRGFFHSRAETSALAFALLLLAAAVPLAGSLSASRVSLTDEAELTLFPKGEWVRPLTFGYTRLGADLCWLEAIQYYGKHRRSNRDYRYADVLFDTATGLDPHFEEAYVFGALILEDANPEAARALLRRGMRHNPESWRICFDYGFLLFRHQKDSEEAAVYLTRSSKLPGAPARVARLAAYAAAKSGRRELAIELWSEVLRSSENEEVRSIARRYLCDLGVDAAGLPAEGD